MRSARQHRVVAALVPGLLLVGIVAVTQDRGSAVPAEAALNSGARSANAFVSSIGVNTHAGYFDKSYGNYPVWRDRLVEAGIRNIRDGVSIGQPPIYERLRELAGLGIHTDLQLGRPFYGTSSTLGDPLSLGNNPAGTLQQLTDVLKGELMGAVTSVEGPNEYDISGDPNWVQNLRDYQAALYTAIKSDPATAALPVLAPSLVDASSRQRLGAVPSDVGNMHNYTGGQQETSAHLDSELAAAGIVSGGKPAWSTESNPNTAVGSVGNQPAVSERAQGIYTLRQYLEDWRKGVKRTFIYELMDEANDPSDAESTWGILHSDGTPKPAFTALKNMISLLADPGPAFTPGTMTPTLSGGNAATRSTLLQKRDGSYWLALWQEDSVYDTTAQHDLTPTGTPVTITVPTTSTFTTYTPNTSTAPAGSASATGSMTVTSSATPVLVKIKAGTKPAPTFATRINVGGRAVTDAGVAWSSDRYYTGGATASYSAPVTSATPTVDSTERHGLTGYDIPVPSAGTYRVRVHTTENYFNAPGKRDFDISAEGKPFADDVDPFQAVGKSHTYVLDNPVQVTDGSLTLRFTAHVNSAAVTGIEVLAASSPAAVARINAGCGATTTDSVSYTADTGYTGGSENKMYVPIDSPSPEADSCERYGVTSYAIPVPAPGTYRVRLHSTELYFTGVGQRVFDVRAEGAPFASGIDLVAKVGRYNTYIKDRPVLVTDGVLNLTFSASVNNATVSAIEVLPTT